MPGRGFPLGAPGFRQLDAVVGGISHQMGEGISQAFDNGFIEFHLLAFQTQLDLLAQLLGQLADHPGELAEDVAHRLHSRHHDGFLQLRGDQVEPLPGNHDLFPASGGNRLQKLVT